MSFFLGSASVGGTDAIMDASLDQSSSSFWRVTICFALAAMGLEWLRSDPTFGTGVSVWLFFPLLAVVWRGFAAGALTAVVAGVSMLFASRALFLPFDAGVFVFTTLVVGWLCHRTRAPRVVDGVLLAWMVTLPATIYYQRHLFQADFNAGLLVTITFLSSQIVPAMLVQWLAWVERPLKWLEVLVGPRQLLDSVDLLVVIRASLIPMILLPLFVTQYFSLTQWLFAQQARDASATAIQAENLLLRIEAEKSLFERLSNQTDLSLLPGEINAALAASGKYFPTARYQFAPATEPGLSLDEPVVVTTPTPHPRSTLDHLYQREVMVPLPPHWQLKDANGESTVLYMEVVRDQLSPGEFKVWGLLAAFIFLLVLETLYRLFLVRLVQAVEGLGRRIEAWQPGQSLRVLNPEIRGWITQADQYASGISDLVDGFNENYRAISESNAERMKLLARLSGILGSISEPLIVTDEKLRPLSGFCNDSGKRWGRHLAGSFAVARAVLEEETTLADLPESQKDGFIDAIVSALQGEGSILNRNLTLPDEQGNDLEFRLSLGVIPNQFGSWKEDRDGKSLGGFVFLLTDISLFLNHTWEQVRRTRLASLENVAVGVAHELNQPLNTIRMATHNLIRRAQKDDLDSATMAAKLSRIDEQVDRMASLVATMRAFSSGDTHNTRDLDPNTLLRDVTTLQGVSLRAEQIDLRDAVLDSPCKVTANSNALGHVFAEIIQNAIEALRGSDVTERWLLIETERGKEFWQASFTDNGGGIPDTVLDRIFEPFFTTKEQATHSGFGLHEAYSIMADFGGTLEATNTASGARFTVRLPVVTAAETGDESAETLST